MDPNANLNEQRELAAKIAKGDGDAYDAERLADLVEALDQWIAGGGFLPRAWERQP